MPHRNGVRAAVLAAALCLGAFVAMKGGEPNRSGWNASPPEASTSANRAEERGRVRTSQTMSTPASARCLEALLAVERAGLALRDDTDFRCPGSTGITPQAEQHWGATCWQNELCPGSSYVAVNTSEVGPDDDRLRYVVAHEICHVQAYEATGSAGTEDAADGCAADAGFSRR